jgi:hypothetical protein
MTLMATIARRWRSRAELHAPLIAYCHLGLGKMHRRTGNHGRARTELAIATAIYREMEMAYWLERAEAEMHQPC